MNTAYQEFIASIATIAVTLLFGAVMWLSLADSLKQPIA